MAKQDDKSNFCANSTWSFVQMNMSLLPIARPLPVSITHRLEEGAALAGVKPCTPTQKLHLRLRQNISPRGLPPTPKSCGAKRKHSETIDTKRRENLPPRSETGYCSDPNRQNSLGFSILQRSASLSSGCAAKGLYKGKRILELQDEERRLHPNERATTPSPSKRSKYQP